jgi:DNA repair protein RecN (Recombination protein N)
MQAVGMREGEVQELEAEHQVLANLDAMRAHTGSALEVLQDAEGNAAELLARAARMVGDAAAIDRRLLDVGTELGEIEERVAEVCRRLQSALGRLDLDPKRLAAVVERLDELQRALKRWGPGEAGFRASLQRAEAELGEQEAALADPEAMAGELRALCAAAVELGRKLLRARRKTALPFCKAIALELASLGMARTEVRVAMADDFSDAELLDTATAHGPVAVDLEVKINPGEPFHSMRSTASGGELARIVLAVKKTLADQDRVPLLVLDEIDAEIGGRLGAQVGHKLAEVAKHHQVVIVTHLPQVAAFGDKHIMVRKEVVRQGKEERTRSVAVELRGAALEQELAAMSAGDGADADAVAQARKLVRRARSAELG